MIWASWLCSDGGVCSFSARKLEEKEGKGKKKRVKAREGDDRREKLHTSSEEHPCGWSQRPGRTCPQQKNEQLQQLFLFGRFRFLCPASGTWQWPRGCGLGTSGCRPRRVSCLGFVCDLINCFILPYPPTFQADQCCHFFLAAIDALLCVDGRVHHTGVGIRHASAQARHLMCYQLRRLVVV